jgi:hypothetical protein
LTSSEKPRLETMNPAEIGDKAEGADTTTLKCLRIEFLSAATAIAVFRESVCVRAERKCLARMVYVRCGMERESNGVAKQEINGLR